jgi:alpha-L-fucosidase 2
MKPFLSKFIILMLLFGLHTFCFAQVNKPTADINWPDFMAKQNLYWEDLPLQWNEGAFTGNGNIGMMIYVSKEDNGVVFSLGRTDVTDHRKAPDKKTSFSVEGAKVIYDFCRLPIGKLLLKPVGKIVSGTIKQDIWNAEIIGDIETTAGNIHFKAMVPRQHDVQLIEVKSTEKDQKSNLNYKWVFIPGNPTSPRVFTHPTAKESLSYEKNPDPKLSTKDDFKICTQPLLAGGDYATVWNEVRTPKDNTSTLFVSIANDIPHTNQSAKTAIDNINTMKKLSINMVKNTHYSWWHDFYKQSFLSIPDARMEAFYWIQLYKMATASRPDGPALDLFGPYYKTSAWPGMWWNLNIQLTYSPVYTSNHLELGENMITIVDDNFEILLSRFCGQKLGDLCWTMHNYWKQYAYAGNSKAIQEKWLPKAISILDCYKKQMVKGTNGEIQLKAMQSPEYKESAAFINTNYNLANLRWLLNTIIQVSAKGNIYTKEIAEWKAILANLIAYPVDENGLMIGSDQALEMSHRHYSHLLALYPFFQLNPDKKEDSLLVDKSVDHWHKIENGKGLAGYSFTGAASLFAAIGRGDDALKNMDQLLTGKTGISQFHSNTFYTESKGRNEVIETPLSGAASIMELLLQSWQGKIRVFPALPSSWKDASFSDLRTEGGYLVSAVFKDGQTSWISIKSKTGEPFILKTRDVERLNAKKSTDYSIKKLGNDEVLINLKSGGSIWLVNEATKPALLAPVKHNSDLTMPFGVKKDKQLQTNQDWKADDFMPALQY